MRTVNSGRFSRTALVSGMMGYSHDKATLLKHILMQKYFFALYLRMMIKCQHIEKSPTEEDVQQLKQ